MKELALRLLLALGFMALVVLLAAIIPVNAQSDLRVAATVPFDFFVGDERLPAGDYIFGAHTKAQGMLVIREKDEGTSLMFLTLSVHSRGSKEEPMLVFHRYNDQYFLYRIWTGADSGYELPKSRTERSIENDLAKSQGDLDAESRVEIVTITNHSQ